MIPLTQIKWEYASNYGNERRGRKTNNIWLNASHVFKLFEEEHGTRVCYSIHGDVLVEETPAQISDLMLRVHQARNAPENY